MSNILVFDIETIPASYDLPEELKSKLDRKVEREMEKVPEADPSEVKGRLQATSPFSDKSYQ
jgi:hypothetical protein